MRIIDCRTGKEVHVGETVRVPFDSTDAYTLLDVRPGFFTARITIKRPHLPEPITFDGPVRYMHPAYPFQRVVFIPT